MTPWAIRSTEHLPTQTSTWTLDHFTIPPTHNPFFQTWCKLGVTTKASMIWSSSRPLSGKVNIVRWTLNPAVRTSKPKDNPISVFFCHTSRRHSAEQHNAGPNTSKVMGCRLGRYPVSFVRWRTNLGMRVPVICSIPCECGQVYIGQTGRCIAPE
jgi:hypothetical protein